jgi:hypothetical protein
VLMTLIDFIILSLAAWRIANLIADDSEDGPFDILHKIRYFLGIRYDERGRMLSVDEPPIYRELGRAVSCMWCLSLWIGLFVALVPHQYRMVFLPFSLSAAALIINKTVKR